MTVDKSALRQRLRYERRAFAAALADPAAAGAAIAGHLLPRLGGSRVVAGFVAVAGEPDALLVLATALKEGRDAVLPRIRDDGETLGFHRWRPGDPLEAGRFGLLQPRADAALIDPDLIITPLVAFDRRLMRLGQGGGFYDRAFARLPAARRYGLAWSIQEVESVPADPWDMPLHGIATETAWIDTETL